MMHVTRVFRELRPVSVIGRGAGWESNPGDSLDEERSNQCIITSSKYVIPIIEWNILTLYKPLR